MDSYQAIYDAVRSRIGGFDGSTLVEGICARFDFSHHAEILKDSFDSAAYEMARPAVLYKPQLSIDGNQWCALYGEDLQSGVAGFGESPSQAMDNFDEEWQKLLNVKDKNA